MRATHGPNWPTHRRKRTFTWQPAPEAASRPMSTDAMAASLVRRGLATRAVLGPPRRRPTGARQEDPLWLT